MVTIANRDFWVTRDAALKTIGPVGADVGAPGALVVGDTVGADAVGAAVGADAAPVDELDAVVADAAPVDELDAVVADAAPVDEPVPAGVGLMVGATIPIFISKAVSR